jgi:hypothetical protein
MGKGKKLFGFGETVSGYDVPVLNEREIRASAGILFFLAFIAIAQASMINNFLFLKYFIVMFLVDFVVRVFVNPMYSPTLIIGRWIVGRQVPEYVSAAPKKFAWIIGLILVTIMYFHFIVANLYGPIAGIICMICLLFLFFESAFGICLGCIFYGWIYKDKALYCPGESCKVKDKQEIQKISLVHVLIVLAFAGLMVLSVYMFNHKFSEQPKPMFKWMEPVGAKQ